MREMKDSGIDWLGEVPAGWCVAPGKRILTLLQRPVEDGDGVVTCFRDGEVTLRTNRRTVGFTIALKEIGYQGVEPGDLVVHGMDGFAGSIGISDSRGKASPVLNVMDSDQNKRFLMYYMRGLAYRDVYMALSDGIRVRSCNLSWKKIGNLPFALPGLDEQRRIAYYLDGKCAEIDRAVSAAERSIEEYKAYKTSTIVRAFNSKDAQKMKLSFFAESVLGKMLDQAQQRGINTHRYLANKDVQWFRLETDKLSEMDFPEDSQARYGIQDGDILACEGGEVGRCAVYRGDSPDFFFQKAVHRVRVNQKVAYPEYIAYQMFAKAKTGNFMEVRKGQATFNHLTGEQLRQLRFSLPSLSEQQRIAGYLDKKCAQIDHAIAAKQAIIADLKAYRQSLIYEAVTGKREV